MSPLDWKKIAKSLVEKDKFSKEVKREAFINAKKKCQKCGRLLKWEHNDRDHKDSWEAHHVIPVEEGGTNTLDNCQILCWPCHSETFP